MKICVKCSKEYDGDIKFCLDCGGALTEKPVLPKEVPNKPPPVEEKVEVVTQAISSVQPIKPPEVPVHVDSPIDVINEIYEKLTTLEASVKTISETNLLLLNKLNEITVKISEVQARQKSKDKSEH